MSRSKEIEFDGVCKTYTLADQQHGVIEAVSFSVQDGTCLSLLGNNGSGKSTILRIACGLIAPDAGQFRVFGGNPSKNGSIRARISAMFEGGRALYGRLTPEENVAYFAGVKGFDRILAVKRFEVLSKRFAIKHFGNTVVQKLSKGTQQKFSLISSLSTGAQLWLLDEPTLGLDADSVGILGELIREHVCNDGLVLMATHDVEFAAKLGPVLRMSEFRSIGLLPQAESNIVLSKCPEGMAARL
jgi:ABC-2 type transport system ATP-binding protein